MQPGIFIREFVKGRENLTYDLFSQNYDFTIRYHDNFMNIIFSFMRFSTSVEIPERHYSLVVNFIHLIFLYLAKGRVFDALGGRISQWQIGLRASPTLFSKQASNRPNEFPLNSLLSNAKNEREKYRLENNDVSR